MSVTIKDVADLSGISVATISKYLNGKKVKPKTADKIAAAVEQLNYRPNLMARGLRSASTMTVGIITDDFTNHFYANLVSLLVSQMRDRGYSCLVSEALTVNAALFDQTLQFFYDKRVDGLFIISNIMPKSIIEHIKALFSNVVVIDCIAENLSADFVLTDNNVGAYHATESLILQGHRRIGILTGHSYFFSANERKRFYQRALEDHNITVSEALIFQDDFNANGGYRAMKKILDLPEEERPTAIVVMSYLMTFGMLIAINEYSISIPDDISVIVYDNMDINQVFRPTLACVAQNIAALAERAVICMLERLKGEPLSSRIFRIAPEFLEGESVKDLSKKDN